MSQPPSENSDRDRARDTKATLSQWARANLPTFTGCGVILAEDNKYILTFSTSKRLGSHDRQTVESIAGDIEVRFQITTVGHFLKEKKSGLLGLFSFFPKLLGRILRTRRTSA